MDKVIINSKLNKDFYEELPSFVCELMEKLIQKYGNEEWFIKAWNEYRDHVKDSNMDTMRMPGYVFKKYINDVTLNHSCIVDEPTKEEAFEGLRKSLEIFELIEHSGVAHDENPPGRGSGRYPFGSGENPYQHDSAYGDINAFYLSLRKQGLSEADIAKGLGMSTTKLRAVRSIDGSNLRRDKIAFIKKELAENPNQSKAEIGKKLGAKFNKDGSPVGESTVRSLLNDISEARTNTAINTADQLQKIVDEKKLLDVGTGIEKELGITRTKLDTALEILKERGYHVYPGRVQQSTNKGQWTTIKVLGTPDSEHKEIFEYNNIGHITDYTSPDNGEHILKYKYPESMDSKRLLVRFRDTGGLAKDGLVEIRRGVPDLSIGDRNYSQVRILVDNAYYIKGMAVYGKDEDFPKGVDVIFNTNKDSSKGKLGALKSIKDNLDKDPQNPFGSAIKPGINTPDNDIHGGQSYYIGKDGKYHLSLINRVRDEGEWVEWSKELPSQMLGKQPQKTIERQLNLAKMSKKEEYDKIMEVSNPTVRKQMLWEFASKCDSAAEELKAAPFPGQKYQVILPLETIKDNECYAPNYRDGTTLALVRYPHAGTFEIPIVKVNNKNQEGIDYITPSARDAIGINSNTASILSGADFDGDTVQVIPLRPDKYKIQSQDPLKGLKGFDPSVEYGPDQTASFIDEKGVKHCFRNGHEYKIMDESTKQREMGKISNLITDMTLAGANTDELAAAVRHSMVVIDAVKHELDYKDSEKVNNIAALHKKYQGRIDEEGNYHQGAATILSRASGPKDIKERKEGAFVARDTGNILTEIDPVKKLYLDEKTGVVYTQDQKKTERVDPKTGKILYRNTNAVIRQVQYKDKNGETQYAKVIEKDGALFYRKKGTEEYVPVVNEKILVKDVTQKVAQMATVDNAFDLTFNPNRPQERVYAEYANYMKQLANDARKEWYVIKDIEYSRAAENTYKAEVEDLKSQLDEALKNTPRERAAQLIAAAEFKAMQKDNPHMSLEEESKKRTRLLMDARTKVGAERSKIYISDKQWQAIQAGAIRKTTLERIFNFADKTRLRQLATPYKDKSVMSKGQISRAKSMLERGYTRSEVAELFGVSTTTLDKQLSGQE